MTNGAGAKTSLGIDENIEAALCYLLGWLTGIVFLILEKENSFVRFHAMQSIVTFLALMVISFVAGWVPLIGWLVALLIMPLSLILWLLLMFKAFSGVRFKLPVVGDFAESQMNK